MSPFLPLSSVLLGQILLSNSTISRGHDAPSLCLDDSCHLHLPGSSSPSRRLHLRHNMWLVRWVDVQLSQLTINTQAPPPSVGASAPGAIRRYTPPMTRVTWELAISALKIKILVAHVSSGRKPSVVKISSLCQSDLPFIKLLNEHCLFLLIEALFEKGNWPATMKRSSNLVSYTSCVLAHLQFQTIRFYSMLSRAESAAERKAQLSVPRCSCSFRLYSFSS